MKELFEAKDVVEAKDVQVGDTIAGGNALVKVAEIITNPHFGWVGFKGESYARDQFDWSGWYLPQGAVVILRREVAHP